MVPSKLPVAPAEADAAGLALAPPDAAAEGLAAAGLDAAALAAGAVLDAGAAEGAAPPPQAARETRATTARPRNLLVIEFSFFGSRVGYDVTVIVGVQAIPACFDVEQHRVSCPPEAFQVHLQCYDTLLRHPVRADSGGHRALDPDDLQPGLAESWELSADGRTCTLQLRRGVLSPEGHELTAHDVKWAWERSFALNSWSARFIRRCGIPTPDVLRVIQPYVLQFKLDEPSPLFPGMLATALPPIYDLETVREQCPVGDPWGDEWLRCHTAGFGPYTLDHLVEGEEAGLAASMSYWEGAARDKRILLRTVAPSSARAEALGRGSIDVADELPAEEVDALATVPGVQVMSFPGSRELALRIDPAFAPFDVPHVREALALSLPYDDIGQRAAGKNHTRGVAAQRDQRRARALLREAGYASGFRMTIVVPHGSPELEAVAQMIQLDLIKVDLKVVVEAMDRALFAREKASRHLPVYIEERRSLSPLLSARDLEPLPAVESILLAKPPDSFVARANVQGFVRRPDGQPRYVELRKA
jgi:ABC-type transport system substrate-binding protein